MNEIVTEMVVVKLGLKIHANFRPTFKIIRPPQANGVLFLFCFFFSANSVEIFANIISDYVV